jgi:hypothetical protein
LRVVCVYAIRDPSCPRAKQGELALRGIEALQRAENGFDTLQLMVGILRVEFPALDPLWITFSSQRQLALRLRNVFGKGDHGLCFPFLVVEASKGGPRSLFCLRSPPPRGAKGRVRRAGHDVSACVLLCFLRPYGAQTIRPPHPLLGSPHSTVAGMPGRHAGHPSCETSRPESELPARLTLPPQPLGRMLGMEFHIER